MGITMTHWRCIRSLALGASLSHVSACTSTKCLLLKRFEASRMSSSECPSSGRNRAFSSLRTVQPVHFLTRLSDSPVRSDTKSLFMVDHFTFSTWNDMRRPWPAHTLHATLPRPAQLGHL